MTPPWVVWVALAGGVGSMLRFLADGLVTARVGPHRPWGTFAVNVTGSFALGLVVGIATMLGPWATILGTGLLGGYTTFSTATWEGLRLVRGHHWGAAAVHTLGLAAACLLAAWLGLTLAAIPRFG